MLISGHWHMQQDLGDRGRAVKLMVLRDLLGLRAVVIQHAAVLLVGVGPLTPSLAPTMVAMKGVALVGVLTSRRTAKLVRSQTR